MHLLLWKINKALSLHFISPWGSGEGCVIDHLQEGWDRPELPSKVTLRLLTPDRSFLDADHYMECLRIIKMANGSKCA